ncbi:aspartyl protease family protein At5g10770-like [Aristolochia californica]|uniref:aspartyl protease family protein At5g10770-like n=1 Tax=Aristolochia californica TaxID=171875 RepID=UPI0035DF5193
MAATLIFSLLLLASFASPFLPASAITAETFHTVPVASLLPSTVCHASEGTDEAVLSVIHRYGPCSSLPKDEASPSQILLKDQARVKSLQSRVSTRRQRVEPFNSVTGTSSLPTHYGDSLNTANYVVTVGLGTPKKDFTVIFDTGSDLTWIQCQPCATSCYSQKEPIFNPAGSSTYRKISCSSAECLALKSSTGNPGTCSSSTCSYSISYGDGSYSDGVFSSDTLTLSSTDSVAGFRFGCGEDNDGLFGETAGLLGLGRDRVSVVSQTANKFSQVFSYCLPSKSSSTGFLSFGPKISSTVKFTQLQMQDPASFYFLNMVGITVGSQKLPISSSVFANVGTIIDSGTVVTRLPPTAYSALRSAFRQGMAQYPSAPSLSILDTCYNLSNYPTVRIPKIGLQFESGVEVDLAFSGIFYFSSVSQVCLAFAGNSDPSDVGIFGNIQQKTYEVVYDVGNKRMGFRGGGCS